MPTAMGSDPTPTPGLEALLLLGDPDLRRLSDPIEDAAHPTVGETLGRLRSCMAAFRGEHGFGRAIAAPQIGVARRILALELEDGPAAMINPEITWRSDQTFTLWDDCLSFPDLLVRVRRYASISVSYTDERGEDHVWEKLDRATAELVQHEVDHLDGVLALDRALDRDAIISRGAFEARREWFLQLVDAPGPMA